MTYILPPGLVEVPFEDGGHWYTHEGRYLKSVGKILNTVHPMPEIDPFYLTRGKMIHDACCLIDDSTLDWTALDSRLEPYCRAYRAFIEMSKPIVELSEQIVVAADFSYGGRLDRVYRLPGRERLILTDIKTGNGKEKRYKLQLAAYALALAGALAYEYDLALLNLGANGQPRFTVLENPGFLLEEWRIILADYLKGGVA
jgi:hypothetical protein